MRMEREGEREISICEIGFIFRLIAMENWKVSTRIHTQIHRWMAEEIDQSVRDFNAKVRLLQASSTKSVQSRYHKIAQILNHPSIWILYQVLWINHKILVDFDILNIKHKRNLWSTKERRQSSETTKYLKSFWYFFILFWVWMYNRKHIW